MRLVHAILLAIATTNCMAQPSKITPKVNEIDCTNITTSPQLNDCVDKMVVALNARLLNKFVNFEARAKAVYAVDLKLGKELIEKVRKAQDSWITLRDLNCSIDAFEVEEGTLAYITTVNNCIIRMNKERIKALKKILH